ncbi:cell wall-active antibiotics response protein LiaF [Sediminibacillus albus]|uniref:Lia operon protein LiaF n=1 Tax=Sediminibacillus albus TaxID=407036 RepID=A0A1G8ZRZ9_9BACI|nr:cell wall-active antibiotics response protein LiaF [Sediminibacillus albus]SDK17892.1 lia operon protein LiaF [Sediminibacillus albus]
MFNRRNTDIIDMILLITLAIFVFELLFHGPWLLFFIFVFAAFMYYGRKKMDTSSGRFIFWAGLVFLMITILNTAAFKFLLLSVLAYFFVKWFRSKKTPSYYQPQFNGEDGQQTIQREPLFINKWLGRQKTKKEPFEWQDINIQTGIGDTIVDMNNTVLPKGEAVVIIRNMIGNIEILVPYEVEVSISHSTLFGTAEILDYKEYNAWNKVIQMETKDYQTAKQKVKIFTSTLVGKIEVKRV